MLAILRKEVNEFFSSLTAYVTVALFLLAAGLFLWVFPDTSILEYGYATLETLFHISPWIFMFLVPAVTMRSFAEEKRSGTFEILATAPVSGWQIIAGKYLAGVLLVLFALLPTGVYYYSVYQLGAVPGNIDTGGVIGSYAGLFLLGAAFTAIGLFASALTSNQVAAFMLAVFLCFFCYTGFDAVSGLALPGRAGFMLAQLGIYEHYRAVSRGVLDTRDLLYFLSFTGLFLLFTGMRLGKRRTWKNVFIVIAGLLIINMVFYRYFTRIDFTRDGRYTLSSATRNMLDSLEHDVVIRVYLEGPLRSDMKRLQVAVRDLLTGYQAYAHGHLHVVFTDPFSGEDAGDDREEVYRRLAEQGLEPTNLTIRNRQGASQQMIFPGALIHYQGRKLPVNLLGTRFQTKTAAESINDAAENLEYLFTNALHKLVTPEREPIAFLAGHGELTGRHMVDIAGTLSSTYPVKQLSLDTLTVRELSKYKLLVIAKPRRAFAERDKFKLDQYLLRSGSLMLLLDQLNADLDSMRAGGDMLAIPRELNLDDMLFRYGLRMNYDLVQDMNCAPIPVFTQTGRQDEGQLLPWIYYPLVIPDSDHPLVRNLDPLRMEFAGSIDTVAAPGVRKTVLLRSSPYSRPVNAPVYLSLADIEAAAADPGRFQGKRVTLSVLLEGEFTSVFKNRFVDDFDSSLPFADKGKGTIIAVADGDVIKNDVSAIDNSYFPLGYDKYTRQTFGNKVFIQNCVDFLSGSAGLLDLRSKDLQIRLLDRKQVRAEGTYWQWINMVIPVLLVVLSGLVFISVRKYRYGR